MKKQVPFQYGKSPNPTNWQEAADALRSVRKAKKPKGEGLVDRLDRIEKKLGESK
jgi:hypothetical protein